MQWQSQKMPYSSWSPLAWPSTSGWQGAPSMAPPYFGDTNPYLGRGKKHHSPSTGLGPLSCHGLGLPWGCGVAAPLPSPCWCYSGFSSWIPVPGSGGTPLHPQVLPWKAKSCQQQAGAGFGWSPCAQTVMDSRWPTGTQGSPQLFFSSGAARRSGPKATSVRRRVVGPGGEG